MAPAYDVGGAMSTTIGAVAAGLNRVGVSADVDNIELTLGDEPLLRRRVRLSPTDAMTLAALLTRAASETRRMIEHDDNIGALVEALRWCSGASDFQEGGQARAGFEMHVRPLLNHFTGRAVSVSASRRHARGDDDE
jgi:hypothetical protein